MKKTVNDRIDDIQAQLAILIIAITVDISLNIVGVLT